MHEQILIKVRDNHIDFQLFFSMFLIRKEQRGSFFNLLIAFWYESIGIGFYLDPFKLKINIKKRGKNWCVSWKVCFVFWLYILSHLSTSMKHANFCQIQNSNWKSNGIAYTHMLHREFVTRWQVGKQIKDLPWMRTISERKICYQLSNLYILTSCMLAT